MQQTYWRYWGKAAKESDGADFHLLPFHCLDVAACCRRYLVLRQDLLGWFCQVLQAPDNNVVLDWLSFWIALHDLGKFASSFQLQRPDIAWALQPNPPSPELFPYAGARHDSLGAALWASDLQDLAQAEMWFGDNEDVGSDCVQSWVQAVTGHHGQPPNVGPIVVGNHFRSSDSEAAKNFVRDMWRMFGSPACRLWLASVDAETLYAAGRRLSWWIAGLTVLSDWIGSNQGYFPYQQQIPDSLPAYFEAARRGADRALESFDVVPPPVHTFTSFAALFPSIKEPSPLQSWAVQQPLSANSQYLFLLEDMTGAGKTEAAMTLTHRLMSAGCANSFFVGLPTMATANAMYGRVSVLYEKFFSKTTSLMLAHGKKNLVEAFAQSIVNPGQPEQDANQADQTATQRCVRWLADNNKKALLAAAGIGTIDQALLAVLFSRHQSLRLLGLWNKVLVVDEVHACDSYMLQLLEGVLEFHAFTGGSAILLSATLPERMKQSLIRSYQRGANVEQRHSVESIHFPLATALQVSHGPDSGRPTTQALAQVPILPRTGSERQMELHYTSSLDAVVDHLVQTVQSGHCALWIRNTIADVLGAYELLSKKLGSAAVMVFHARFALADRLEVEGKVLSTLGKSSGADERSGRVILATQVVEQSLDIDADEVVTDLAPIDRIIQRAGRLRRHARDAKGNPLPDGSPDMRGTARLWIYGPAWTPTPAAGWLADTLPKSTKVYANHAHMWLTAALLQRGALALPQQAREVMDYVYGDRDAPAGLTRNAIEAIGKDNADASFASGSRIKLDSDGYVRSGLAWASDVRTTTRLGEKSQEVLLARHHDGALSPWHPHVRPELGWELSSVKLAERLIVSHGTSELKAQINKTDEHQAERKLYLVLTNHGNELVGNVQIGMMQPHADDFLWVYDKNLGLRPKN